MAAVLSLGRITFSRIATQVATTTGDLPKMVVAQSGNAARELAACVTPIPNATERPTMEVLR